MTRLHENGGRLLARLRALRFMLGLSVAVLAALAPQASWAVDFRWSNGFGQGWLVAVVRNATGANLSMSCNLGAGAQYAAYSVTLGIPGGAVSPGRQSYAVQFVVDGRNQPVSMTAMAAGGQVTLSTDARPNPDLRAIQALVASLRSGRSLVVEVPQLQISQTFSLLDAGTALEGFNHCGE